jgi:hypothetical protein
VLISKTRLVGVAVGAFEAEREQAGAARMISMLMIASFLFMEDSLLPKG